eukprot:GFYU01005157.1.p1 GENE.GFYU01005157.1~~GFYU01005157.1.p1  ORF type:complete len:126 (+),score=2.17 GFYU01005157.1:284-661(+)
MPVNHRRSAPQSARHCTLESCYLIVCVVVYVSFSLCSLSKSSLACCSISSFAFSIIFSRALSSSDTALRSQPPIKPPPRTNGTAIDIALLVYGEDIVTSTQRILSFATLRSVLIGSYDISGLRVQ